MFFVPPAGTGPVGLLTLAWFVLSVHCQPKEEKNLSSAEIKIDSQIRENRKKKRCRCGTYFRGGIFYAENQAVWGAPLVQKRSILDPRSFE